MTRTSALARACVAVVVVLLLTAARLEAGSVTLAWDPNPEPEVTGYLLLYGTQPGVYTAQIDVGNHTQYSVLGIAGGTYYFTVEAYTADGTISAPAAEVTAIVRNLPATLAPDFDGDARTDLVVRRSSDNTWYVAKSGSSYATYKAIVFGNSAAGDMPLSADMDGDGVADVVTFRPSTGQWSWLKSTTGFDPAQAGSVSWGIPGDVPMLADMDGDGKADIVIWRPSSGWWVWLKSSLNLNTSQYGAVQFGVSALGDKPMLADMDGDGKADIIVWRASQQAWWYWLKSSVNFDPSQYGALAFGSGSTEDVPLTGDFDGDGKADPTIWRPGPGMYWVVLSSSGFNASFSRQLGGRGDRPLLGDFDGDGQADLAVWRASNGTWYWLTSGAGWTGGFARPWGAPTLGDVPVVK